MQTLACGLRESFALHGERGFIQIFHVEILQDVFTWHVAEQRNLIFDSLIERMLGTAHNNVRPDPHALERFDARLGRLRFHFAGSLQIGDQRYVDQDGILAANVVLELTDRLEKRLALNVADGAAYFDNRDLCLV